MSTNIMTTNATNAKVFVYTGEGGTEVPDDVARVKVDSTVSSIPANAFCERKKLVGRGGVV